MKTISRYIMTLALLITAVGGAWAQTEELLTTIKPTGDASYSETPTGVVTVTHDNSHFDGDWGWLWFDHAGSVTVEAKDGYTITKCVFSQPYKTPFTVSTAPFKVDFIETSDPDMPEFKQYLCQGYMDGVSSIEVYGYAPAPAAEPAIDVTTNAASEQDLFTEAWFTMPASDATVSYTLVRDMQDKTKPVTFSGLPTTTGGSIVVKKGSDGKYQPAEELNIQLIDPLAAAEAQNIIGADGITIKVLVGAENGQGAIEYDQENPKTLEAFLADMKPGYYWIKAESTDENSPYDGTVYSSEFTVEEKYDLTVKPADEYSKTGLDNVTVGTETPTINEAGEAAKTGIAPNTEVKIKAKTGYIITDVNATNINQVSYNEAKTEATFTIPQSDVTATYTIKRDMSVNMAVTVQDAEKNIRFRVQKQGNTFVPVGMNIAQIVALFTVHDNIEDKDLTANTDFTVQFFAVDDNDQPYGEAILFDDFDFAPGRYVAKAVAVDDSNYSGETVLSNVFILFQGYEVEVPAGEYITYYKDEALYVEDTDAKLYTITAVSGTTATAQELTIAPANTPILVKNNGSETKTILLIPTTTNTPDNVTPYEGFTGTLEAATIAASNATQDNYAWNGLQFVWVKTALSIAANKAWLQVPATASAPQRIQIVFSSTTGIGAIDSLQSEGEGAWYDLNGRRLPGKPTKKGVYIVNGKKMVVK